MSKVFCMGAECPAKNTCIRYTKGLVAKMYDEVQDRFIRKCTNQKKYIQDSEKINKDSKRT